MKNISTYILLLIASLMMTSCDDYLTQESPDQPTTDQIWVSYEAAEKYLVSAYSYMGTTSWRYHEYFYLPQNFRGDDVFPEYGTTAWSYLARVVGFGNSAADGVPAYLWKYWYKGIKLANDVIENVPGMDVLSQDQKEQLVAEARFLRGFYLFNLKKNFHAIIVPTSVASSTGDLQLPTASNDEVYQQIEADLKYAAEFLPSSWDDANLGRATNNAAYAFLGKSYLYNKQYEAAGNAFANIKGQDLVAGTNYRSMFDGSNEHNEEIIFSCAYTDQQMDIVWQFHQLGVAMSPAELLGGWHMASISDYYMSQLEANDVRRAASVLQHGEVFDGEVISFDEPDFKMSIKFVESLSAISTNRSVADIILMRYADVLLMQAECYYELGDEEGANEMLTLIRQRAGLSALSLSGDALRDEIRRQRLIELVGEGHRYYDLVRWGIAGEQLTLAGQPYAKNFEEKYAYFPIPLEEVQRNPMIEPTPGF